jgi:serralysin
MKPKRISFMKKILLFLTLLLSACKSPSNVPCPSYARDVRDLVSHTCISKEPKKINASAWSKNANKWDYTSIVLYFYPEKNLIGKESNRATSPFVYNVLKHAKTWEDYSNFRFYVTEKIEEADIRISNACIGHWSAIGSGNKFLPKTQPTMNLEFDVKTTEEEYRRTVLHEFGHMLGLEHELMSPMIDIKWNRQAVIDFYTQTQGWSVDQIERNVLNRYQGTDFASNGYDPDSIMLYPVDWRLTLDGFGTDFNTVLSEKDVHLINVLYPKFIGKNGLMKKNLTNYKSRLID